MFLAAYNCRRYLLAEKLFDRIDIFEQRSSVSGIWNYSPSADKANTRTAVPQLNPSEPPEKPTWHHGAASFISPLYSRLETNTPKEMMTFSDKPFPPDEPLFPPHPDVKKYVEEYAEEIKNLIQFETQVLDLKSIGPDAGNWSLTTSNVRTGIKKTDSYDAVVVSNGNYSVPYVPNIPGIDAWNRAYADVISHSKFYDSPESFKDKKVVVVGNSASGIDIATQINEFCRGKLLLSSRANETPFSGSATTDKMDCPEIVQFLSPKTNNRGIKFANGRVEEDIDAIVFSTGYLYSYPFLDSLNPPVVTDGGRTMNIYQQLFYIHDPTLVFTVLPQRIVPFPLAENQAAVFARVWSGRLACPSLAEMRSWEDSTIAEKGNGKSFHILTSPQDVDYLNLLYDWAAKAEKRPGLANEGSGKQCNLWGDEQRWLRLHFQDIKRAFMQKGKQRQKVKSIKELGFNYDEWKRRHARGDSRL